jgi:rhamnogalacturonan hydrolase
MTLFLSGLSFFKSQWEIASEQQTLTFLGGIADGAKHPPLYLKGSDFIPPENITVEDFSVWTESGNYVINRIQNIYGGGDNVWGANNGIKTLTAGASPTPYTTSYIITAPPAGWTDPPYPAWAAPSTGYGCKLINT